MEISDDLRPLCCERPMAINGHAESGKIRWLCSQCKRRTTQPEEGEASYTGYDHERAGKYADQLRERIKQGCTRFVITAAQNNTRLDTKAFATLKQIAKFNNAALLVIPVHYKNINLYTANQEYTKWWTRQVRPYLIDEAIYLGGNIEVQAQIKVAATAVNPLSGKDPIGGKRWTIYGHAQRAMRPVAAPATEIPKRMYTTGVVTMKNYSRTDAGAKALFHHSTGALIVEVKGRRAFVRNLSSSKGAIYDLEWKYTPVGRSRHKGILSLTPGDEHEKFMLPDVRKATFEGPDSILHTLKPKFIFRHDVLDGYAGSHHHEKSYATRYAKFVHQDGDYQLEVDQAIEHINKTTPKFATSVIVSSNHHNHLSQWAERVDDRLDHVNADFACEVRMLLRSSIRSGGSRDVFRLYAEPKLNVNAIWLDGNKPFMTKGVDNSQHGHIGPNGSRGSLAGFAKTVYKITKGHTHSPGIEKGVFQTGKCTWRLEYEQGYSTHSVTHCIQYPDGKRTLIDIMGDQWRG